MNIFFKFLAAATVATMTIPAIAADDSSNDYISSNPFETMIRLGRISEKSPVYQMPTEAISLRQRPRAMLSSTRWDMQNRTLPAVISP